MLRPDGLENGLVWFIFLGRKPGIENLIVFSLSKRFCMIFERQYILDGKSLNLSLFVIRTISIIYIRFHRNTK